MSIHIGTDLGGTKIELIALDESGAVLTRPRVPTPQGNYAATLAAIHGLVQAAEAQLSGPGLSHHHAAISATHLSAEAIVEAAGQGDAMAQLSLQLYESRLARGLCHVINLLDPEAIVLGGGMSNIRQLYTNIPGIWQRWIFSDVVSTRWLPPQFGDSSGVRGAAWLGRGGNGNPQRLSALQHSESTTSHRSGDDG